MPSAAFGVFNGYNSYEVKSLATIFKERNAGRGPNMDYGLLHGGLILLVSGWETYCEDVAAEAVRKVCSLDNIHFDDLPENVRNGILQYTLDFKLDKNNILQSNLAKLPDGGWKKVWEERVKNYLRDFNTPKFRRGRGKSLLELFGLYLSSDVKRELEQLTGLNNITDLIDKIISIRGTIAHKGRPDDADRFYAEGLEQYLAQATKACAAIDCMIYTEFREKYNITPWKMTKTVSEHLPGYR